MPGLFDNGGPSGGIGGILGGLGATLFPGVRQYQLQNRQFEIMQNQFDSLMAQPNMTPDKAIAIISDPNGQAAATQYGMHQFEGPTYGTDTYKPPGPIYSGGRPINQPIQSPQQPQPTQQPAASTGGVPRDVQQAAPVMDFLAQQKAKALAAAKAAEQTATTQPDLPVLQSRSQTLIGKLLAIRDNPELSHVVGGPLGIKGRAGPLGQGQSDLINDIQDANNALQSDLFTSLRATSGRGVSPGALKEMRITDLQAGRTGTLQGYKDNIDKTIKQIQDEYEAAWKARGSSDAYKPNWTSSVASAPKAAPPAPAIAALKAQPNRRAEFDSKYGEGAAMSVLGR